MKVDTMGARCGLFLAVVLSAPLLLWAPSAEAQSSREAMIRDWERNREGVLAFARAMPEQHLDFRPTPEVRTFAEQIEHIVRDNAQIVATAFGVEDLPDLGDRERYLTRSDALAEHVQAGYDFVLDLIREASEEEMTAEVTLFGRVRMPGWRALEAAREHATWTLGQTIPYLRLNGVQPPAYPMFHPTELGPPSG